MNQGHNIPMGLRKSSWQISDQCNTKGHFLPCWCISRTFHLCSRMGTCILVGCFGRHFYNHFPHVSSYMPLNKIEDPASVFISALFWLWKSWVSFPSINKMKGLIPKWFTPHVSTNYLCLLNHSNNLSESFNTSTFMEVVCFIITIILFIVSWNVNLRNISGKYLLECIGSLQHYEFTRRYNLLPSMLASPLTYAGTHF